MSRKPNAEYFFMFKLLHPFVSQPSFLVLGRNLGVNPMTLILGRGPLYHLPRNLSPHLNLPGFNSPLYPHELHPTKSLHG